MTRVLTVYSRVTFGNGSGPGALFFLATFLKDPAQGLSGILGLLSAYFCAGTFGRSAGELESSGYALNGLLVGLALGFFFNISWPLAALLFVSGALVVSIALACRHVAERYISVPVLSWPFVATTWIALLAARRFVGVEIATDRSKETAPGLGLVPEPVALYFESLGACFLQPSGSTGVLVFVGMLCISRWATVLSVLGFAWGSSVYLGLGGDQGDLSMHFVGCNFILTSIAIGGVFTVLTSASIALSMLAVAVAAMIGAATLTTLELLGIPPLTLPFLLTTGLFVFTLSLRQRSGTIQLVAHAPGTPEQNLTRAVFYARRYPDSEIPLLHPPVLGQWLVTQGLGGPHTHQGLWSQAWDFEVADSTGATYRGSGTHTSDYHAWGAPVVAPADGTVIRVVSHIDDNLVGAVDTVQNWGNLVLLCHGNEIFSLLCHLKKGSVLVREGERVRRNQVVGEVGNSGRSPVPHLHFHVQATPEIGAPTRPARLLHYVVKDTDGARYETHGIPSEGQQISPMQVDRDVQNAVNLPPGTRLCWCIEGTSGTREEIWQSTIDPLGFFHIESNNGGRAGFYRDENYFTVFEYEGPRDSLLAFFYLGTPRVPFIGDSRVAWRDAVCAGAFVDRRAKMLQELLRPIREVGSIQTTTVAHAAPHELRVNTNLGWEGVIGRTSRSPDRVEVVWATSRGPFAIRVWSNNKRLVNARVLS